MKKMDPVVHFEMPYEDKDRLVAFYSETFGWNMQPLGAEMGDYVVAETTETDENMMPKTPGAIGGGFYPKAPGIPESPSVVISIEDIDEAIKKVVNGGGTVLDDPMEITGIGMYVAITDTEGNRVGLLQPFEM